MIALPADAIAVVPSLISPVISAVSLLLSVHSLAPHRNLSTVIDSVPLPLGFLLRRELKQQDIGSSTASPGVSLGPAGVRQILLPSMARARMLPRPVAAASCR